MDENVQNSTIATGTVPNSNITVNIDNNGKINTSYPEYVSTVYDTINNKVIIAYSDTDNNGYGTVVVGIVSIDKIIFSDPIVFNDSITDHISVTHSVHDNKIIIAYRKIKNEFYGEVIVGTVDNINNSIVFGKSTVFNNSDTWFTSTLYDTSNSKVIIVYNDNDNNSGNVIMGTIVDNSIEFSSPVVFSNNDIFSISTAYNFSNNKLVIAYSDSSNNNYGTAIVGTVTDDNIIFGSPTVFNDKDTWNISATYNLINNKVVIAYNSKDGYDNYGKAIVGSITDNDIVFGIPVIFNNNDTWNISTAYNLIDNKIILAYNSSGSRCYGNLIIGSVYGNDIIFSKPIVFNNYRIRFISALYSEDTEKIIILYNGNDNDKSSTAIAYDIYLTYNKMYT